MRSGRRNLDELQSRPIDKSRDLEEEKELLERQLMKGVEAQDEPRLKNDQALEAIEWLQNDAGKGDVGHVCDDVPTTPEKTQQMRVT